MAYQHGNNDLTDADVPYGVPPSPSRTDQTAAHELRGGQHNATIEQQLEADLLVANNHIPLIVEDSRPTRPRSFSLSENRSSENAIMSPVQQNQSPFQTDTDEAWQEQNKDTQNSSDAATVRSSGHDQQNLKEEILKLQSDFRKMEATQEADKIENKRLLGLLAKEMGGVRKNVGLSRDTSAVIAWEEFLSRGAGRFEPGVFFEVDPLIISYECSIRPNGKALVYVRESFKGLFESIMSVHNAHRAQSTTSDHESTTTARTTPITGDTDEPTPVTGPGNHYLITGTPGTGKSCFAYYLLPHLLAKEGDSVLYQNCHNEMNFFVVIRRSKGGFEIKHYQMPNNGIPKPKLGFLGKGNVPDPTEKPVSWYIFDSGHKSTAQPRRTDVPTIVISSPDCAHYKDFLQICPEKFYMPTWEWEEIDTVVRKLYPIKSIQMNVSYGRAKADHKHEIINVKVRQEEARKKFPEWDRASKAFTKHGGVIREVLNPKSDERLRELNRKVDQSDVDMVLQFLKAKGNISNAVSHSILHQMSYTTSETGCMDYQDPPIIFAKKSVNSLRFLQVQIVPRWNMRITRILQSALLRSNVWITRILQSVLPRRAVWIAPGSSNRFCPQWYTQMWDICLNLSIGFAKEKCVNDQNSSVVFAEEKRVDYQNPSIDFASPYVRDRFWSLNNNKIADLHLDQLSLIYDVADEGSRRKIGEKFEDLVHEMLTAGKYVGKQLLPKLEITADADDADKTKPKQAPPMAISISLNFDSKRKRPVTRCEKTSVCTIVDETEDKTAYVRPNNKAFPAIDAFLPGQQYLLQITVSKNHPVAVPELLAFIRHPARRWKLEETTLVFVVLDRIYDHFQYQDPRKRKKQEKGRKKPDKAVKLSPEEIAMNKDFKKIKQYVMPWPRAQHHFAGGH